MSNFSINYKSYKEVSFKSDKNCLGFSFGDNYLKLYVMDVRSNFGASAYLEKEDLNLLILELQKAYDQVE